MFEGTNHDLSHQYARIDLHDLQDALLNSQGHLRSTIARSKTKLDNKVWQDIVDAPKGKHLDNIDWREVPGLASDIAGAGKQLEQVAEILYLLQQSRKRETIEATW